MGQYPKRLIEVDLPIKRISAHSRREKSIRHGHISTLHIWWARRPLAACRAVICASLWPDPADELCPEAFREEARKQLGDWAKNHLNLLSDESSKRFIAIQKKPEKLRDNIELRKSLLDFIADFANWDNSTVKEFLETSRALTQSAHVTLGGAPETRPLVVDPFAGGGAIPLESLRVGADTFASDLNPVAVMLNRILIEYIPKFGERLSTEVNRIGKILESRAEGRLGKYFPVKSAKEIPVAYIWSRTILSEAPGTEKVPIEIPLIRSLWLSNKGKKKRALRWVKNNHGLVEAENAEITYTGGEKLFVRRPILEVFEPKSISEVESGTVARGKATCPVTGYTIPIKNVRKQLKARKGGTWDSRLICVVSKIKNEPGRTYRIPDETDAAAFRSAKIELEKQIADEDNRKESNFPFEKFTGIEPRRIPLPQYGISGFRDLFAPRPLLIIKTIIEIFNEIAEETKTNYDKELLVAVFSCLACAIDRIIDQLSSIVVWASSLEVVTHTFGRQALPMAWDYVEPNIFAGAGADFGGAIKWVIRVIEHNTLSDLSVGTVQIASAINHPLPDNSADAIITDPPYYYSVPYADLSDFFYIWLRRTIKNFHPDLFLNELTPKEDEIIQNLPHSEVAHLQKSREFFEKNIRESLCQANRIAKRNALAVVVFAHTETAAWESLLKATIEAGWVITGSWPIDTERTARVIAQRQSTLASSIHLVCRPREKFDNFVGEHSVGDWRDVLLELPRRIKDWMTRLSTEGIVGADAIFACLGPALEIFSKYSRVEKANGEPISLPEFLEQVWATVSKQALNMIFDDADTSGFEEDSRLTAIWLWTLKSGDANGFGTDEEESYEDENIKLRDRRIGGFSLEYDSARKIAQGIGAHLENLRQLVSIQGETAILLSVANRSQYLFGKDSAEKPKHRPQKKHKQIELAFASDLQHIDKETRTWIGDLSSKPGRTVLDQLHQSMILFAAGRSEALKRILVEDGVGRNPLFWRLAQALSALYPSGTDEKRWVDGVLARKKGLGF